MDLRDHVDLFVKASTHLYSKYTRTPLLPHLTFSTLEHVLLDLPTFPTLLLAHALFAADRVHALTRGKQFWLKSLVLTFAVGFGGSTLASLLAAFPAPLATAPAGNKIVSALLLAWTLINMSPPFRALYRARAPAVVFSALAVVAKCRAVFGFVDRMVAARPGAYAGAVLLGGLAGSGGTLFVSLEKKWRKGAAVPSELSDPKWGSKSSFLAAFLYYVLTDPERLVGHGLALDSRDVAMGITLFLVGQMVVEVLLGREFSPLYYLEQVLYALLRLPRALETQPKPAASAAAFVAKNTPRAKKTQ